MTTTRGESIALRGEAAYAHLRAGLVKSHLPALDGLRAVAVLQVILYHVGIMKRSAIGVLVFFVLSGFLITWLMLKETARDGDVSLSKFYVRRSLRIFPAFYAYAVFALALAFVMKREIIWPQVICALLYVANYYQGIYGDPATAFSHTWSLGIEEQFYLLWPSAYRFLRKRQMDLAKALAVGILLVWTWRLVLVFVVKANQSYLYAAFDTRADSLMMGCLLAVLLWQQRLKSMFTWLCDGQLRALVTLGLLFVSVKLGATYGTRYRDTAGFAVDSVLVGVLIVQMIAQREAPVGRWLNWGWMRYLGTLSYSLYLYQQIGISPAEKLAAKFPVVLRLPVIFGVVLVLAMGSYYLVERPTLKIKERFSSGNGKATA